MFPWVQGSDVSSMVSHCAPHPMVIIIGDHKDPVQAFLVCEKKILCEISTKDIPVSLLMPYYTFNMCYPKGCSNFYTFIEVGIFNMSVKNVPHTLAGLLTRLNALKLEHTMEL